MTERLLAAATRLAEVLALENAALFTLDLHRAAQLLVEKRDAAQAFADAQAALGTATPTEQAVLAGRTDRLRVLARENRALLERALAVQTRVIGIIARAARPGPAAPRYCATGRMADTLRPPPCTLSARA